MEQCGACLNADKQLKTTEVCRVLLVVMAYKLLFRRQSGLRRSYGLHNVTMSTPGKQERAMIACLLNKDFLADPPPPLLGIWQLKLERRFDMAASPDTGNQYDSITPFGPLQGLTNEQSTPRRKRKGTRAADSESRNAKPPCRSEPKQDRLCDILRPCTDQAISGANGRDKLSKRPSSS